VSPKKAEQAIRAALVAADHLQIVKNIMVDLKKDTTPQVFKDRFLAGFGRCWGISHGMDDIGRLTGPRAKRSPTILAPDSQAYRDILADIMRLRKA
jgi:hypothetical protein